MFTKSYIAGWETGSALLLEAKNLRLACLYEPERPHTGNIEVYLCMYLGTYAQIHH